MATKYKATFILRDHRLVFLHSV